MNKKNILAFAASSLLIGAAYADTIASPSGTIAVGSSAGTHSFTQGSPTLYVKETFNFNTSPSVGLGILETQAAAAVASVHSDGRYHFGGSSEGGAVSSCEATALGPTDSKTIAVPSDVTNGCADYS